MPSKLDNGDHSNVDKSLVAMFLKMSPEERLQMNDNAVCTIMEMRDAYNQQKLNQHRLKRNTGRT